MLQTLDKTGSFFVCLFIKFLFNHKLIHDITVINLYTQLTNYATQYLIDNIQNGPISSQ